MAGQNLLIGIVAIGAGLWAYSQGWLCQLKIPQLCPSDAGSQIPYLNPGTNTGYYPTQGAAHWATRHAVGEGMPGSLRQRAIGGGGGYGDDGYGDDYGYESNAAHISIA